MKPNPFCVRAVDFIPASEEERSANESDGRSLDGYAAVFDVATEINSFEGHFSEKIARGAFRKTIAERTPVLQFDHGHDARTGTVPIGKIDSLTEDRKGLRVQARLFDNPVVEPIRQAIEGGAISGMSFRFKVVRDQWHDNAGNKVRGDELGDLLWNPGDRGPLQRTIREVQLFEAGPVVFPAYEATSVGVRSLSEDERKSLVDEYVRTAVDDTEEREELTEEDGTRAEELVGAKDGAGDESRGDVAPGETPDAAPEGTSAEREEIKTGMVPSVRQRRMFLMNIKTER